MMISATSAQICSMFSAHGQVATRVSNGREERQAAKSAWTVPGAGTQARTGVCGGGDVEVELLALFPEARLVLGLDELEGRVVVAAAAVVGLVRAHVHALDLLLRSAMGDKRGEQSA